MELFSTDSSEKEILNNYYKEITDNAPVIIWRTSPNGHCTYLNKQWYEYTGQSQNDGIIFGWLDLLHPDDIKITRDTFLEANQNQISFSHQVRIKSKSENYRWFVSKGQPKFDLMGNFEGFIGSVTDIHEQKIAEEALKKSKQELLDSEKRYHTSLKYSPIVFAKVDKNLRYEWIFNPHPDFDPQTVIGKRDDELAKHEGTERMVQLKQKVLDLGQQLQDEIIFDLSNGQRTYNVTATPIFDQDHQVSGILTSSIDITDKKQHEGLIVSTNKRLHLAISAADLGLFHWNVPKDQPVWENDRMYEIFGRDKKKGGVTKPEFIQKFLYPEDLERFNNEIHFSIESRTKFRFKGRIFRENDSQLRWIEYHATFEYDNDGNPCILVGVIQDITDRKLLEEQLQNERELLQKIYDTIPVMLTIWDPKLNVTNLNKEIERVTGWTNEECQKTNIMDLVYPDPEYKKLIAEYMNSLNSGFKDIKMYTKNGQYVDTSWANVRISDGRNVGIGLDISQRKKLENQLIELSKRLMAVVENITDGVVVYGSNGQMLEMNKAAKQIVENLLGNSKSTAEYFELYDEQNKIVKHAMWPKERCLRGEQFSEQVYLTQNPANGKTLYLEYSGIPVYNNKELVMAVITVNDITEKVKDQLELKKANEALLANNDQLVKLNQLNENLLYILAHDLRNPITNIKLILDLLKNYPQDARDPKLLESIGEMVNRQDDILNGLVELLEIQSPEQISAKKVDLNGLMGDIIKENQAALSSCNGIIDYSFNGISNFNYVPSFVYSIIKNLVSNSIKYRKDNRQLEIKINSQLKGGFILVVIQDNGIGIDLNRHGKNLFRPFRRFTKQSSGTGIGLYIIKHLIEKNGGYIEVESKLDVGTTFYCYFKEYV